MRLIQVKLKLQILILKSSEINKAIDELVKDQSFQSIEKEKTEKGFLIDWIWLLVIATGCFSAEWLLRKYYGML